MPEYALLYFGAWLAGVVVVPIDVRTQPGDLQLGHGHSNFLLDACEDLQPRNRVQAQIFLELAGLPYLVRLDLRDPGEHAQQRVARHRASAGTGNGTRPPGPSDACRDLAAVHLEDRGAGKSASGQTVQPVICWWAPSRRLASRITSSARSGASVNSTACTDSPALPARPTTQLSRTSECSSSTRSTSSG